MDTELIKSIGYVNSNVIADIVALHIPNGEIECDVTYSKGAFYKDGKVREPKYKFDINPIVDGCVKADCRSLPLEDGSIKSIMFDPPFLATKGKSLMRTGDANIIANRFSVFPDEKELHLFYKDSLREFRRVMADDGILIFKCQDKVSSGKQYMSHVFVHNEAVKAGFYPLDLFVLASNSRIVANWQRVQKHARKYHCYFWVFKKCNKRIKYV